jgi:hypothetical protein
VADQSPGYRAIRLVPPPPSASRRSAAWKAAYMPCTPSQRSGSGSQRRTWRPVHGQPGQLGVGAEHQVAQGRPARLVVVSPLPT